MSVCSVSVSEVVKQEAVTYAEKHGALAAAREYNITERTVRKWRCQYRGPAPTSGIVITTPDGNIVERSLSLQRHVRKMQPRKFSDTFKLEVVNYSSMLGPSAAAKKYDVCETTVRTWRKRHGEPKAAKIDKRPRTVIAMPDGTVVKEEPNNIRVPVEKYPGLQPQPQTACQEHNITKSTVSKPQRQHECSLGPSTPTIKKIPVARPSPNTNIAKKKTHVFSGVFKVEVLKYTGKHGLAAASKKYNITEQIISKWKKDMPGVVRDRTMHNVTDQKTGQKMADVYYLPSEQKKVKPMKYRDKAPIVLCICGPKSQTSARAAPERSVAPAKGTAKFRLVTTGCLTKLAAERRLNFNPEQAQTQEQLIPRPPIEAKAERASKLTEEAACMRAIRLAETPAQQAERLLDKAACMREKRWAETPFQRAERVAKEAARKRARRLAETPTQRAARTTKEAERMRARQMDETPAQRAERVAKDAARKRARRLAETPTQQAERRKKDAERKRARQMDETPTQRAERLSRINHAARMREKRWAETPIQRAERVAKEAARKRARRLAETPAQRAERLSKNAALKRARLMAETPIQRAERLSKDAAQRRARQKDLTSKARRRRRKRPTDTTPAHWNVAHFKLKLVAIVCPHCRGLCSSVEDTAIS